VLTGVLVGLLGVVVQFFISELTTAKFNASNKYIDAGNWPSAFFSYLSICLVYALIAGGMCWIEPAAAGSGIPEVRIVPFEQEYGTFSDPVMFCRSKRT
jgi:H+/Cl- antiporter ClcA